MIVFRNSALSAYLCDLCGAGKLSLLARDPTNNIPGD